MTDSSASASTGPSSASSASYASAGGSAPDAGVDAELGGRRRSRTPSWITWTIAVVFGLFFAYDVWEAVGNLVGVTIYAGSLDTTLSATGWVVLILGLVLPVLSFVIALVAGRRLGLVGKIVAFAIALCVSAALALDVQLVFGFGSLIQ